MFLADDFSALQRSQSQASEETPPHVYSVPAGFPHSPAGHRPSGNFDSNSLSGKEPALFPGLVPEASASNDAADPNNGNTSTAGTVAV